MINRLFAILTKHLESIAPCKDVERMTVKENELNGNDLRSENDKKKTKDKKGEITLWFLAGANILALLVIFFLVTILIAKQTSSNIV
jgi:type VI protein secretion system component VasF